MKSHNAQRQYFDLNSHNTQRSDSNLISHNIKELRMTLTRKARKKKKIKQKSNYRK